MSSSLPRFQTGSGLLRTACRQKWLAQDCSVLERGRPRIKKFKSRMIIAVGTDVSRPNYHTAQSTRGIIRLNQIESLAWSQRRISFDSGAVLGHVYGRPFETELGIIGFNHQDDGSSDWLPL